MENTRIKRKIFLEALDYNKNGKIDIEDIIVLAMNLPGVKIKRDEFLRKEFSTKCNKETLVPDSYIQALKNEISFRIKHYGSKLCKTVYIGGGTPSLLSIEQFSSLFDYLSGCLEFTKDYEFTVEMNPDDITQSLIGFFNNSIVTRISCGIQSLDQKVLEYVKRRAGVKENLSALKILKEVTLDKERN